jgi:hypothetical protein
MKALLIAAAMLITPAFASPEIPKPPLILPSDMLDYGMWREEHDRATFPRDFPLQGEPYDWATGNAIRAWRK